jgi:hypothetical protein
LKEWPPKTVATTRWLEEKGVSRQLVDSYKNSGWLERFERGAYKRPHEEITWTGALYTLQKLNDLPVHIGGKTALEQKGFGHYIRKGAHQKVILWKEPDVRLPAWFQTHEWDVTLHLRSVRLFENDTGVFSEKEIEGITLRLSSPEQAIMEYLYDIPKLESYDEANYIMEGLSSLRPSVVQSLLEGCQSIKVKRLFLYLAEMYNHSWFKRLDPSSIDFGSGKREIIKGGKLDKKYQIVVPELNRED